jgi:sugar phosphate isomerase/epimerase
VRRAERVGGRLALENISHCNVATGAEAGRLLDGLGSGTLSLIWDPGNALWAGERPYPEGYRHVRGRPSHVHVKDLHRPPGVPRHETTVVGRGEVDYAGQLRALWDDGYRGALTLEPECAPPGGTREDGTRGSVAGLRRILARLSLV